VHADSEHEQDDSDLGQLRSQLGVGHKTGRKRSNRYAGQKITYEWW
jgi:hypothetical protein